MAIKEITRKVYVYAISSPPLPDRTADAEITISNSQNISLSSWAITGPVSQYNIAITSPKLLGLVSGERSEVDGFVSNVLLAFNLLMKCGAMLTYGANMDDNVIKREPEKLPSTKIEAEGNSYKVTSHLTITHVFSANLKLAFKENVNENEVKQILILLQNLDTKSTRESNQLKKALENYGSAVSSFDRRVIFKNLFNAMALATNSDGTDRMGKKLAKEIASITNENLALIEQWNEFNNRTKHIDLGPNDEKKHEDGMKNMPSWILPLRDAAQKIILAKLGTI